MGNKNKKQKIGILGESVACNYLKNLGYSLIEMNASNRAGEIDIVMKNPNEKLVFIEVKTVKTDLKKTCFEYDPIDKLSYQKIQKLHKTINYYLKEKNIRANWQLDAVVVYLDLDNNQARCRQFEHITNQW